MKIPFVIDNRHHRLADTLNELLGQTAGRPLDMLAPYEARPREIA